jgi:hypothetical protein
MAISAAPVLALQLLNYAHLMDKNSRNHRRQCAVDHQEGRVD